MIKTISSLSLLTLIVFTLTGCSDKDPEVEEKVSFECKQENVLAPKWTCIPYAKGFYAGLGISEFSKAGVSHMRKVALANGRSDLAQQIQTEVKDRVQVFTRATGNGDSEVVDKVSTAVTDQLAKVNLQRSNAVDMWNAPSGAMYLLVTVPQADVNMEVQEGIKSSFKNDNALWQQFQAKQAQEALEEAFPTN